MHRDCERSTTAAASDSAARFVLEGHVGCLEQPLLWLTLANDAISMPQLIVERIGTAAVVMFRPTALEQQESAAHLWRAQRQHNKKLLRDQLVLLQALDSSETERGNFLAVARWIKVAVSTTSVGARAGCQRFVARLIVWHKGSDSASRVDAEFERGYLRKVNHRSGGVIHGARRASGSEREIELTLRY